MGKKLYVGNLNFDTTEEELEGAFSQFGNVVSAVIIKDPVSGRSRGFGFVEFADEDSARTAKDDMNGKELKGRALKVDEAREQRQQRRSRDGGGSDYNRRRF
jgi:RNA recognition motif-containing protein